MSATDAAVQEVGQHPTTERIVNDFAIQVATVNGSGSQTANLVLLQEPEIVATALALTSKR